MLLARNLTEEIVLPDKPTICAKEGAPLITVIIPARNEEEWLEATVLSVLSSDYPNLEIILVDDRSSDATPEIMKKLGNLHSKIRLLTITRTPPDWTGKTHALHMAAKEASSGILLFLDADTIVKDEMICKVAEHMTRCDLDAMSVLPGFIRKGFWEKVVHPHLALGIAYFNPLTSVNDPSRPAALASGSFLALKSRAYLSVGSWERFKDQLTEDIAMSRAIKRSGLNLKVARSPESVLTRGFQSFHEISAFWRRTFYGAFDKSPKKLFRLAMNYISLTLLSLFLLGSGFLVAMGGFQWTTLLILMISLLDMAIVMVPFCFFLRRDSIHWAYGFALPLGVSICSWIALDAFWTAMRDTGVSWRGHRYR